MRIAGNGTSGYSGDSGPAAEASLNAPFDLAWDSEGNLYIGQDFRISKVDNATGVITTIAGTGAHDTTTTVLEIGKITLDGADSDDDQSAVLLQPMAVALDGAGNIYVTDGAASHSVYRFEP